MSLPVGQCGLCLETTELLESHLLPAALYKISRDPSRKVNPDPVVVTKSKSFTTSKQVSTYFLCKSCEQRLSEGGESYVLDQCARRNGQFKLRELMQTTTPLISDSKFDVYDAEPLLGSKVDQYLYFAASVFWRASAHRWRMGNSRVAQISLGAKYQEQFRLYLLGKEPFPTKTRLVVHVSSETKPQLTTVFPCAIRTKGVPRHKFYIPGILFILFLSGHAIHQFDSGALNGSKRQLMWLCAWQEDSLFYGTLNLVKVSKPAGRLRR